MVLTYVFMLWLVRFSSGREGCLGISVTFGFGLTFSSAFNYWSRLKTEPRFGVSDGELGLIGVPIDPF